MFHATGGLFFERQPDDSVRITKRETAHDDAPVVFDITVDQGTWCSIIASMSRHGEGNYGFYRAAHFHNDAPITEGLVLDTWGFNLPPGVVVRQSTEQ